MMPARTQEGHAPASERPRRRWAKRARTAIRYVLMLAYVAFVLLPIVYMVLIAFHTTDSVGSGVFLPPSWHWQTFIEMWSTITLGTYVKNSFLVALTAALCASLLAFGASYVVARFRFRLRQTFRMSLLASQTVPGVLLLLPLFVIYVTLQHVLHVKIVGGYFGIVLAYMTFGLPFSIWMLSIYIIGLPVELEEQGLVDGATRFQIVRAIILPLTLPGLVVAFVFSFLLGWNDVLFATALTSPATRTLAVGLQAYLEAFPAWNQLMAASLLAALPATLLFLFVQRYIVTGLTGGSLKG